MGAAPTVPGIRLRFSRPGQPGPGSIARSQASPRRPRLRRTRRRHPPEQMPAGNRHVQHQAVEVAGQHQVAAAAQDEARRRAEFRRRQLVDRSNRGVAGSPARQGEVFLAVRSALCSSNGDESVELFHDMGSRFLQEPQLRRIHGCGARSGCGRRRFRELRYPSFPSLPAGVAQKVPGRVRLHCSTIS